MASAPVRIVDPDDPRIAAYRGIRERDLVGRQGRFVAEGKVVLNVLFASRRFAVESVLLLENRLDGMAATLLRLPEDIPVYIADGRVMDTVAGFHVHRGVLAIGRRGTEEDFETLATRLPDKALALALVGISNHDNMGGIFRNAAAFGADAVLLDDTCCDPLYRKAIRVSVGATLKVPFARAPGAQAMVTVLDRRGFDLLALTPRGDSDLAGCSRKGRTALFLGSEGTGLPPALLAHLPTVRIAMAGDFDSLNVAAASAVALHRLWRPSE